MTEDNICDIWCDMWCDACIVMIDWTTLIILTRTFTGVDDICVVLYHSITNDRTWMRCEIWQDVWCMVGGLANMVWDTIGDVIYIERDNMAMIDMMSEIDNILFQIWPWIDTIYGRCEVTQQMSWQFQPCTMYYTSSTTIAPVLHISYNFI